MAEDDEELLLLLSPPTDGSQNATPPSPDAVGSDPLSAYSPSKGGPTKFSEIPPKDVIIVLFMLGLWLYSITLIVRAWAKVHHMPGDSSSHIGGNMWRFVVEYLRKKKHSNSSPAASQSAQPPTEGQPEVTVVEVPEGAHEEDPRPSPQPANAEDGTTTCAIVEAACMPGSPSPCPAAPTPSSNDLVSLFPSPKVRETPNHLAVTNQYVVENNSLQEIIKTCSPSPPARAPVASCLSNPALACSASLHFVPGTDDPAPRSPSPGMDMILSSQMVQRLTSDLVFREEEARRQKKRIKCETTVM